MLRNLYLSHLCFDIIGEDLEEVSCFSRNSMSLEDVGFYADRYRDISASQITVVSCNLPDQCFREFLHMCFEWLVLAVSIYRKRIIKNIYNILRLQKELLAF